MERQCLGLPSARAAIGAAGVAILALAVAVLTNLVTGDGPRWWVWAVFGLAATGSVVVSARQGAVVAARDRQERRDARAQVLPPLPEPLVDDAAGTPHVIALVDPVRRASPLFGRSRELRDLLAWCTVASSEPSSVPDRVLVVEGVGGVGKTRLAVEVAAALPADWYCGRPLPGRFADVMDAVLACDDPTLVVVDDADTCPEVRTLLESVLRRPRRAVPLRILLLVRDAAAFRAWLAATGSAQLSREWPHLTVQVTGGDGDRRRWFVAALRSYLAVLQPAGDRDGDRAAPSDVGAVGADGEPFLVTCLRAALAAVQGGSRVVVNHIRQVGTEELAAQLVAYEKRRWARSSADPVHAVTAAGLTDAVRAEAVLMLVATNPTGTDEAVSALGRLAGLQGHESMLGALAAWVAHLYAGQVHDRFPIEVQPDFLRSALVAEAVRTIARPDDTSPTGSDPPTSIARLDWLPDLPDVATLSTLVRAASWFPAVNRALAGLLERNPAHAASVVEAVALAGPAVPRPLVALLAEVLAAPGASPSPGEVERLMAVALPERGLAPIRVALLNRVIDRLRVDVAEGGTDDARSQLSTALLELCDELTRMVDDETALTAANEAVALRRQLMVEGVDGASDAFAQAMTVLGRRLGDRGRYQEGLSVTREAVELCRSSTSDDEPARRYALADVIEDLAGRLHQAGENREALAAAHEAVDLFRVLADNDPVPRHRKSLSMALRLKAEAHHSLLEYREGVDDALEAVEIARSLVAEDPQPHVGLLGAVLRRYGDLQRHLGEDAVGRAALQESVELQRRCAADERVSLEGLAISLQMLAISLADVGQLFEALTTQREAVALRRRLATDAPSDLGELASALYNLAASLARLGEHPAALEATQEAADLHRSLAVDEPCTYDRQLARSLYGLGLCLQRMGQHRAALPVGREATDLFRRLASVDAARWTDDCVEALTSVADILEQLEMADDAQQHRAEAVAWRARLADLDATHTRSYRESQAEFVLWMTARGHDIVEAYRSEEAASRRVPG